jgi:glycosyltransferase involved in cell wall biosynthesis
MRCPTLDDLPPPPPGNTGWPWTVESPQLADAMAEGRPWPRISIVTPSYNQGRFIEETIRSVLLQGYPDLEYIVVDGASTDNSVEIIKKYEPWLSYWVSEKDRGQAHAINKGLSKFTGRIASYLNSDDYLLASALAYVGKTSTDVSADILIGRNDASYRPRFRLLRRSYWKFLLRPTNPPLLAGPYPYNVNQESTFWNADKYRALRFDESLQFCLDFDWFQRLCRESNIVLTSFHLGHFRSHPNSKTVTLQDVRQREHAAILDRLADHNLPNTEAERISGKYYRRTALLNLRRLIGLDAIFVYQHP